MKARWPLVAALLLLTLSPAWASRPPGDDQPLSAAGQARLSALIDDGHLAELQWPDFTDYRVHLKNFYQPRAYALAWTFEGNPTPQAETVIELLAAADAKGLQATDYDGPRWAGRLSALSAHHPAAEDDLIRFDLALTVSLMRYISDLHIGKVNPTHFKFGLDIEHKKYKLQDLLRERIIHGDDVAAVLAQVEPQFDGYRRTVQALQSYLALARQGDGDPLPIPQKPVSRGEACAFAPALAKRLTQLGDLPLPPAVVGAPIPPVENVYDGALVEAVQRFQKRHGLEADGRLDARTVAAMNVPLKRRVEQLQWALERWRWIPPDFPQPPIIVNIPEFRLRAFDEREQVQLNMPVVVGRAYRHQTPVFANEMKLVVFRPFWNVPISIQRAELLPKIRKDRLYLAHHGYEAVNATGQVAGGVITDASLQEISTGRLAIRQKPGNQNALGPVKFLFPNAYDVYLHGTPEQDLFAKARRDFSHGCIRVEDPFALASWVLRNRPEWTAARIRAAMKADASSTVTLDKPIPVLILYTTAVVQTNGEVDFFDDIYGHDADLEQVLAKGYPYPG